MSAIQVTRPTRNELKSLDTAQWTPWSCDPSEFDWEYTETETAYVHEGHVTVRHAGGETEIEAGDLVVFPKGMKCTWDVHKTIRKIYTFDL